MKTALFVISYAFGIFVVLNTTVLHFYVLLLEEPRIEVRNLIHRAFLHVVKGGRLLGGERPRERGCELQNLNANFILQDMPQLEEVDVEDPLFIRSLNNKVRKICCNRAIVSPIVIFRSTQLYHQI